MIIKHIRLTNFRNYGRLDLDVGPSVNILCGNNAQGKTNLIEAISVCSSITSHRTSKDRELIKNGEEEYDIKLDFDGSSDYGPASLENRYLTEKAVSNKTGAPKRELRCDGMLIDKTSEYIGLCNTVIFAPEDLNIVKGAPANRRKFLNMLISKVSPTYYNLLARMNRCLSQKTSLLKSYRGNSSNINDREFDFWDFTMADLSVEIILIRLRFIHKLSLKAASHHSVISDGQEVLTVTYDGMNEIRDLMKFLEDNGLLPAFYEDKLTKEDETKIKKYLNELILQRFKSSRKTDVEKGICTTGIHRDDIDIKLNGLSMKVYCSQGQQRSAALALKLAELEMLSESFRESPILLLDDVFSELDKGRRMGLLAGMHKAQIFITCTDRDYIEKELQDFLIDDVEPAFFRVNSGSIVRE